MAMAAGSRFVDSAPRRARSTVAKRGNLGKPNPWAVGCV